MKRLLLGALLGLVIALGGTLAYSLLFQDEAAAPEWVLASYSGAVQVSHGGDEWEPAEIKMRLTDSDRIRTGADGEAQLLHDDSHVAVRPMSELTVASLTDEASDFDMTAGNLYVEARGDRIRVETASDAEVDARDAGFGLTVQADGFVEVAVKRGLADITSMGVTQHVAEGEHSTAVAGRPPTRPEPIPEAILLNVSFPDADTFNARLARVQGKVEPGTRVRIGGGFVETNSDGSFEAELELEEGANRIEVQAQDTLGRTRTERSRPIHVDVTPPSLLGASIGSRTVSK